MAITTYTSFVTDLAAMAVTGVTRRYGNPPKRVQDLPASYPRMPKGREAPITFDGGGGWPRIQCDLVILIEPVLLNLQPENYDTTLEIMDALSVALRSLSLAKSKPRWTIRAGWEPLGETTYWAVIATVEASG